MTLSFIAVVVLLTGEPRRDQEDVGRELEQGTDGR